MKNPNFCRTLITKVRSHNNRNGARFDLVGVRLVPVAWLQACSWSSLMTACPMDFKL